MFFKRNTINLKEVDLATPDILFCESVAITDKGPLRPNNEDTYKLLRLSKPPNPVIVAMVADGMGGHNAGEEASRIACTVMSSTIQQQLLISENYVQVLSNAIIEAHAEIQAAAALDNTKRGMGCTLTCALICCNTLYMVHVGDSRLYILNEGGFTQLSEDQTIVNEMCKKGKITTAEKDNHEMKNILMQALGSDVKLQPQILKHPLPLLNGDKLLLCTDGVYDVLKPTEIEMLVRMNELSFAKECLSAIAYQRNASDNFSAILLKCVADVKDHKNTKEINALL